MSYKVKILADSVGPHGIRLTSYEVTFPRFLLAEINTHRALSRNSASSRAIPTETQIQRVKDDPFIPTFNKRVKGMGVGEELSGEEQEQARAAWIGSMNAAIIAAGSLLHVDKSRANRLLEPFQWHAAIISGSSWSNFFALRNNADAQPEIQHLAAMMEAELAVSVPVQLSYGDWHLPMVSRWVKDGPKISAGRCARVSYDTHNQYEPEEKSIARAHQLMASGHWSPFEHPAQCTKETTNLGNFQGWKQYRKFFNYEDDYAVLLQNAIT